MLDLLNQGYNPTMFPDDPNDKRTTEERVLHVLFMLVGYILVIIIMALILSFFPSCASHRYVCGVTDETTDTVEVTVIDSTSVTRQDVTAMTSTVTDTATSLTSEQSNDTETETVTEHIVTTTDSLGNTTTTTDRTVNRQRSSSSNRMTASEQRRHEEQTAVMLSKLDSIVAHNSQMASSHTNIVTTIEEQPVPTDNRHWWTKIADALKYIILGGIMTAIGYLAVKYYFAR